MALLDPSDYNLNLSVIKHNKAVKKRLSQESLDEIVEKHNKWLSDPEHNKDSFAFICQSDLSGLSLKGCCLNQALFINCLLAGTDFQGASLQNAVFEDADLSEANFSNADCNQACFTGVNLYKAKFYKAFLGQADFNNADLRSANFMEACLPKAQFNGATLVNASFAYGKAIAASFIGANLEHASFLRTWLDRALFKKASLDNTKFIQSCLDSAVLDEQIVQISTLHSRSIDIVYKVSSRLILSSVWNHYNEGTLAEFETFINESEELDSFLKKDLQFAVSYLKSLSDESEVNKDLFSSF